MDWDNIFRLFVIIIGSLSAGYGVGTRLTRNSFANAVRGSSLLCPPCKIRVLRQVFHEVDDVS